MAFWRIIGLFLILAACKNTTPEAETLGFEVDELASKQTILNVAVDHLRLRTSPDATSEVIRSLREGEVVIWNGEESEHHETVNLRGKSVSGPWYRVTTEQEEDGWVFSGALEVWKSGRGVPYSACLEHLNKADFSNYYPCLDGISHTLSGPEKVVVTPDFLLLKLGNGGVKQLDHNRTPGDDYRWYQYLGLLSQTQMYVIKINRQGGSSFMLVSRISGETLEVAGIPQPLVRSNDLFCLGALPGNAGDYQLQIVQSQARNMRIILEEDFKEQSLASLSWGKDGLPTFVMRDLRGNPASWSLIRKGKDKWDLERAK